MNTSKAKQIKALTDVNSHCSAFILCCEIIGPSANSLRDIFRHIKGIEELEGELPNHLSQYRYEKYSQMIKLARITFNEEDYMLMYESL